MKKKSAKTGRSKKRPRKSFFVTITLTIIIIAILIGVYFLFFYTSSCEDKQCFDSALDRCKRVSLIKTDENAVWSYKILGPGEKGCRIEVELIQLKRGQVEIQKLEENKMVCDYVNSESYPEDDVSMCSGKLKEELQDIIIKRMHDYLLKNLGDIQESFTAI